jgi:hypothetical protein
MGTGNRIGSMPDPDCLAEAGKAGGPPSEGAGGGERAVLGHRNPLVVLIELLCRDGRSSYLAGLTPSCHALTPVGEGASTPGQE